MSGKICERCGKRLTTFSWERLCYPCQKENARDQIVSAIKAGEEKVDTGSSDYVICPYCVYAMDTCYGYEDLPELYEEGDHVITCPECDQDFILNTSISYYYETEKRRDNR
jgi:hypothetical protein